jgi:fucose permease
LIPITTVYWASAAQFFIQGVSSAFYDLGGNQMILSLWSGISHSPINLMHAGYGVGAILSVQLAKPFIKFDPMDKYRAAVSQGGVNRTLVADESSFSKQHIDLRVPYWVSAICALVISALFLVAQLGELGRKESKNINCSSIEKQDVKLLKENETIAKEKNKSNWLLIVIL